MASTRTTPTSPRTVRSIPKGIDLNKQLSSHDLTNLEVTDLTIGGEIVLGAGTVGLTLGSTAATPAEVLRFNMNRVSADGDAMDIVFRAQDSDNVLSTYMTLRAVLNDNTAGTFDSSFEIIGEVAGTQTTLFDSNVSAAGVVTSTFPTGDVILSDNVSLQLGTAGAEADISSDGTNVTWNELLGTIIFQFASATDLILSANLIDVVAGTSLELNNQVRFDTGVAATGANYQILRNADGTNLLQLNVPTGASFEFSVNDVAQATLSATILDLQDNALTTTGNIGVGAAASATNKITSAVGTITTAAEMFTGTGTWNDAAVTFDALTIAVTNTASAAASRLINLSVGGGSQFSVTRAGVVTSAGSYTGTVGNFTAATNQLVLDSDAATTTTITATAPAASAVVTIADLGAAWTVVGTTGVQAITGVKTFTSPAFITSPTAVGATWVDLGTVTTADINGGTLDGVTIGATTPAAATVSTLSVTGTDIILDSDIANTGTLRFTTGAAAAVITLPNATGTLYSTVASSISSAQLLSSMSDETGTGLLVFATAPAIVGGSHIELTGLSIRSTGAAFDQLFATATVFTADRTLNFAIGDADRTLTMTGNATLNQDVSTTANPTFANLTITSFAANWTNAGRTVADAGILTTVDINGGSIDGTAIGAAATSTIIATTIDATTDFTIGSLVITSNTLTATGRLTTAMTVPTVGTGFDGALVALWVPYGRKGAAGPVVTEFIVDLTNLVSSATDADIIGETDAANANLGQITAAIQGTPVLIEMVCLETPAGGSTDLNLYSATEATGTEDTLVTDLTETLLLDRGAAWANGDVRGATVMPAANEYLYLANGAAGTDATYTAGKFKITIYGTV